MTELLSDHMMNTSFQVSHEQLCRALHNHWPKRDFSALEHVPVHAVIRLDSRLVEPGDVFIARKGSRTDGHAYIGAAVAAGASVVLMEDRGPEGMPAAQVPSKQVIALPGFDQTFASLVKELADIPTAFEIIAVTGTNGKSSVTHYVAALSEALGKSTGLMGTLGVGRPGALSDTGLTTPDPLTVAQVAHCLSEAGCKRLAIEASSHALDQNRLAALSIKAGIFTNLTRDHLDYHGSMLAYAAAKAKLFQRKELEVAVINADDPYAALMVAGLPAKTRLIRVGGEKGDFRVLEWMPFESGQQALIETPEGVVTLRLTLLGRFNLDNVLLAIAVLYGMGESLEQLLLAASRLIAVAGRMERIMVEGTPLVVVDYSHTPDALENALTALHDHVKGNMWCVVGCGGDRDNGKRPLMAEIGARLAQHLVITDDNPRTESPDDIRAQMITGIPQGIEFEEVADRKVAIEHTIANAGRNDLILIAGKGHEGYQEINGVKHPFSDADVARKALDLRLQREQVHD